MGLCENMPRDDDNRKNPNFCWPLGLLKLGAAAKAKCILEIQKKAA